MSGSGGEGFLSAFCRLNSTAAAPDSIFSPKNIFFDLIPD